MLFASLFRVSCYKNIFDNLFLFNLRTRTINKCFNLPEGDVECLDTPVEKLIKVTSQVCDGEKYIQKCFKIGVARCYESSVMILISALIHNSIAIEDMAQNALQR